MDPNDPANMLTDELAAQINAELEFGPDDLVRHEAVVRPGDAGGVELVLLDADEDSGEPDVMVALTPEAARALAAALLASAGPPD